MTTLACALGAAEPTDAPTNAASAAARTASASPGRFEDGSCIRILLQACGSRSGRTEEPLYQSARIGAIGPRPEQVGQLGRRQLGEERRERGDERRLHAGLAGQGERRLQVLLRPAEPVLAPLGERPAGAAPERERVPERARVDAERAPEPQRLDVGADAGPEEDVVRRLRHLTGADVAD